MPFTSLGLPDAITRGVEAAGYETPTPIQAQAIPLILPGHDLVAAAQTGSGKTAAFLLPIMTRLLHGHAALRALVLEPTRELAAQVEAAAHEYGRFSSLRFGSVYGGVPIAPQERMLRREGVDILVATPGRLLDLAKRQSVSLEEIEILVLDEADRMVDMGFAPDLRRILALLPKQRQTLMFSATMPPELNTVAREALSRPRRLDLAPPTQPASGISQSFYPVLRHRKLALLDHLLKHEKDAVSIVFARTKRGADRVGRHLRDRGHNVAVLHGDRSQDQRERALGGFRDGRVDVLVATDIASRGIDVDDITHVINFDVPRTPEDYVHRIGRTGRMDATGDALTLVTPEEAAEVKAIERALGHPVERMTMKSFDYGKAETAADRPARGRAGEGRGERPAGRPGRGHGSSRSGGSRAESRGSESRPAGRSRAPLAGGRGAEPGTRSENTEYGRPRKLNPSTRRGRKRL